MTRFLMTPHFASLTVLYLFLIFLMMISFMMRLLLQLLRHGMRQLQIAMIYSLHGFFGYYLHHIRLSLIFTRFSLSGSSLDPFYFGIRLSVVGMCFFSGIYLSLSQDCGLLAHPFTSICWIASSLFLLLLFYILGFLMTWVLLFSSIAIIVRASILSGTISVVG